jgi:hypothetical protein
MKLRNRFLLLDSAIIGIEIIVAKSLNQNHDSLFKGSSEQPLAHVSPNLFSFDPQTDFAKWYMQNGWGNSWGILVNSDIDLKPLVKHFRHFLMVKKENGEQLYFRFYDPRVLRVFLPTCDERQLNDFFGPVDYFICEDKNPADGLVFSLHNGELEVKKIKKDEVMTYHPEIKKRKFGFF